MIETLPLLHCMYMTFKAHYQHDQWGCWTVCSHVRNTASVNDQGITIIITMYRTSYGTLSVRLLDNLRQWNKHSHKCVYAF